jgi:hypothetical protein
MGAHYDFQLTKGKKMKLRNRTQVHHSHKQEQRMERDDDDQAKRDKIWIRSMRRLTRFIRIERYIVNDFYFNQEVEHDSSNNDSSRH